VEDERGKIQCTYWRDGKNKQNLNMMGRAPLGDSGTDGIMILK